MDSVMEYDEDNSSNLYSSATSRVEISHAKFWSKIGLKPTQKLNKKMALDLLQKARLQNKSENYLYSLFNTLKKLLPNGEKILPKDVNLKVQRKKVREESIFVVGRSNLLRHFLNYITTFDASLLQLLIEFRLNTSEKTTFSLPDGYNTRYDIDTGIAVVSMLCINVSPTKLYTLQYKDLSIPVESKEGTRSSLSSAKLRFNAPFFNKYASNLKFAIKARFILFEESLELVEAYAKNRDELQLYRQPLLVCKLDTIYKNIRNKYVYINKMDVTGSLGLRAFRKLNPAILNEIGT